MIPRLIREIANSHPFILLIVLSILIGTGGFCYYNQRSLIKEQAEIELLSIARLKVHEISLWRDERLADGRSIMDGFLSGRIWQRIREGEPFSKDRAIMARLNSYKSACNYKDIEIIDRSGAMLFSTDERRKYLDAFEASLVRDAIGKKQVLLSDLHRYGTSGDIC